LDYLKTLHQLRISPNFWCSEEYLEKAGLHSLRIKWPLTPLAGEGSRTRLFWVVPDGEWWLAPPLEEGVGVRAIPDNPNRIWSDFSLSLGGGTVLPAPYSKHLLDYEYMYDPWCFRDLSGGRWRTFRKNINKWERENKGRGVTYMETPGDYLQEEDLKRLMVEWLGNRDAETIHDDEVMLAFVFGGRNRAGLFRDGELIGLNVWDHSWAFINFRYSICLPEPGLADYLRLQFYRHEPIQLSGKLVNDGGVLDKPSLKFFKDRLNPVRVREVFSWAVREEKQGED